MDYDELNRIEDASSWYIEEQVDFDRKLIGYRYKTWKPRLVGPKGLELGSAEGVMTRMLLNDFENLTIVDAAARLLDMIPDSPKLEKVHSLFENYSPDEKFNSIILDHILEHIDDPVSLMKQVKRWLAPAGRVCMGVPNGNSIHRLAAVKMGLLSHPCELNERDIKQGHRRVYTPDSFKCDIEISGLSIIEMGGIFYKPLSNPQIDETWTEEMMDGFYELGKEFPENSAAIFAICQ